VRIEKLGYFVPADRKIQSAEGSTEFAFTLNHAIRGGICASRSGGAGVVRGQTGEAGFSLRGREIVEGGTGGGICGCGVAEDFITELAEGRRVRRERGKEELGGG